MPSPRPSKNFSVDFADNFGRSEEFSSSPTIAIDPRKNLMPDAAHRKLVPGKLPSYYSSAMRLVVPDAAHRYPPYESGHLSSYDDMARSYALRRRRYGLKDRFGRIIV